VPGARVVREAKSKDVSWLARTDPDSKEVEFSAAWNRLGPEAKKYIALHERAHLETGTDHNMHFYAVLKKLVIEHRIPWRIAYELESYNCHAKH
jgi:predicted metal-dependent hydrolase